MLSITYWLTEAVAQSCVRSLRRKRSRPRLAGCGKSPHLKKAVMKSARNVNCTLYKSMGYRGTKTAGLHQKHRSATFSAAC
jgi:hypothetical protein